MPSNGSERRRVAVTGLGVVSSLGNTYPETWENLVAGKSGAGPLMAFDHTDFKVHFAAEVKNFDPDDFFEAKNARRFDRYAHFGIAASQEAIQDAGLEPALDSGVYDRDRAGCIMGNGIGGLTTMEEQHSIYLERGAKRITPFLVPRMMMNAGCGEVAIRYKLRGPNFSTASACASGAHAIGLAFRAIQWDEADVMVCGGTEAAVSHLGIGGFSAMKALSTRNEDPQAASRPFDADRDGFVLSEGAGMIVLEELEMAKKRGAKIYCEITGFGMSDDGHHMTAPEPEGRGMGRAMELAIRNAGISPDKVDYINAHGTSTHYNDKIETQAIKTVFGDHAGKLQVSSTKSMTGHALGGAGGIEAVFSTLAIYNSMIPPTINYTTPDDGLDLDYVPNEARACAVKSVLSNSFGFGGHNASLLFEKLGE